MDNNSNRQIEQLGESTKDIFFCYFKDKAKIIIIFLILFFTMFIVYGLYGIPYAPAIYTAILMLCALLVFAFFDFYNYQKDIVYLQQLKKLAHGHLGKLSVPKSFKEKYYVEIINALEEKHRDDFQNVEAAFASATQYYTLWSHQVKTPIAAAHLLLSEDPVDSKALEQELFKIEQYVDMALQYQRLQATENDLMLKECPLDMLVKQSVKRVSSLFIHKKVNLELEDIPCKVLTDEKWLVFILEQILSNAVKYTPSGGKVLVYMDKNSPCTLVVQDSGIGISPQDLPRVFDWGYTGYNGRLDNRSTGIGLSMCHKALAMLGNSIAITSTVGNGSSVRVNLYRKDLQMI